MRTPIYLRTAVGNVPNPNTVCQFALHSTLGVVFSFFWFVLLFGNWEWLLASGLIVCVRRLKVLEDAAFYSDFTHVSLRAFQPQCV